MADLAAHIQLTTRPRGADAYIIADGVTLYHGTLVGIEGGYANHWADGANDVFAGVMIGGDSRANDGTYLGETSDTPPPRAYLDTSGVVLMHLNSVAGSPDQTKVGDLVYCGTSNVEDMTLSPTGRNHPIGILVEYRSATDVDVQLFTPAEMLAQATA